MAKEISCLQTINILIYLHKIRKWVSLFGVTEFLGVMLPWQMINIFRTVSFDSRSDEF